MADVLHVAYESALGTGAVHVSRNPIAVLPSSQWEPLRRRRVLMITAGILLFLIGVTYVSRYANQHEWFTRYGGGTVALLAALATVLTPLLGAAVVGHFALSICARGPRRPLVWLAAVAAGCALTAFTSYAGQPSVEDATEALRAGDVPRAYLTAVATHDLRPHDATSAGAIADDAHLQLVNAASDAEATANLVRQRWYQAPKQVEAHAFLRQRLDRQGRQAFERRDASSLASLAEAAQGVVSDSAAILSGLAASLGAEDCLKIGNYSCAADNANRAVKLAPSLAEATGVHIRTKAALETRHRDALNRVRAAKALQDRRQALVAAIAAAHHYELIGPRLPGSGSRDLAQQLAKVDASIAQIEQRQRQQEEARRRRRIEMQALAPLRCRDGTLSPSCVCGGSRRGCCSHHGGVAGCSADY